MVSLLRKIQGLEGRDGVLSISIAHGFPWGDVPIGANFIILHRRLVCDSSMG
jgi:microcystin degradation protein MlrC